MYHASLWDLWGHLQLQNDTDCGGLAGQSQQWQILRRPFYRHRYVVASACNNRLHSNLISPAVHWIWSEAPGPLPQSIAPCTLRWNISCFLCRQWTGDKSHQQGTRHRNWNSDNWAYPCLHRQDTHHKPAHLPQGRHAKTRGDWQRSDQSHTPCSVWGPSNLWVGGQAPFLVASDLLVCQDFKCSRCTLC